MIARALAAGVAGLLAAPVLAQAEAPAVLWTDACPTAFNAICEDPVEGIGGCPRSADRADCRGRARAGAERDLFGGYDDRVRAPEDLYPWSAVGAVTTAGGGRCTASLINPTHALTAAHCVSDDDGAPAASAEVIFGGVRARVRDIQVGGPIWERARDPFSGERGLRPAQGNDWAILGLDRSIEGAGHLGVAAFTGPLSAPQRPSGLAIDPALPEAAAFSFNRHKALQIGLFAVMIAAVGWVVGGALQRRRFGLTELAAIFAASAAALAAWRSGPDYNLLADAASGFRHLQPGGAALHQAGYSWDTGDRLSAHYNCRILHVFAEGAFTHTCDTTNGDSGSPILVSQGEDWYVIGVHIAQARFRQLRAPKDDAYAVSADQFAAPVRALAAAER